MHNKTIQM